KGTTITINAIAGIQDFIEESAASTASKVIGGTFGSAIPAVSSITATEGGVIEIGAGEGDTVTIVFDTPTNMPTIAAGDIANYFLLNGGSSSWGTPAQGLSVSWSDNKTLVITLGSDTTAKKGQSIQISTTAGIRDIGEESSPSTGTASIAHGSFGTAVPMID